MRVVVHKNKYEGNMAAVRIELLIIRLAPMKGNLLFCFGWDAALRRPAFVAPACIVVVDGAARRPYR
jgi:hypothetical protein